jgi:membrane-bound lytic murein transglycosylase A
MISSDIKKLLIFIGILAVFIIFVESCTKQKKPSGRLEPRALVRIELSRYPDFADDMDFEGLARALQKSISYLRRVKDQKSFEFGQDVYSGAHMIRSMEHFLKFIQTRPDTEKLKQFIRSNYLVYQFADGKTVPQVLFTGYYEPQLFGSLTPSSQYQYPVYARPNDLAAIDLSRFSAELAGQKIYGRYTDAGFIPYFDRQEIDEQGLIQDRAEVIAWVKDRIALFFLHIQGSGKILLPDGRIIHVHYHGKNGRPYRSIGKMLMEKGRISKAEMSMQKIRAYLENHPAEIDTILNFNPSYIFFKLEDDGPLGALEVSLTPGRSIATDRTFFPQSALAFIQTQKPLLEGSGHIHSWTDFSRFVLNQDTGGAIKGPLRADFFWGAGPYAEVAAGHMKRMGNLSFLILKPDR